MKMFWTIYLTGVVVALIDLIATCIWLKDKISLSILLGATASWIVPFFTLVLYISSWANKVVIFDFSKKK